MYPVVGKCPVCGEDMVVTRLYCRHCDSALEGHFTLSRFHLLDRDQLDFAETFIRCEGKINRVEEELGISYPTVRARLGELIRALGYEVEEEEPSVTPEKRKTILEDLTQGKITSEEAIELLRGSER